MEQVRLMPRVMFAVLCLLAIAGCGQFFPNSSTITGITVTPSSATVAPGVTQQYTATGTFGNNSSSDVTSSVTWSVSPTNTATINSSGLLTAVATGTATVKATSGSVVGSTGVTVANKQVKSLTIAPLTQLLSLSAGPTMVQFRANATYSDGSMGDVTNVSTWTADSSPTGAITISSTGLATENAVGTANVTATSGGVTASSSATVTGTQ